MRIQRDHWCLRLMGVLFGVGCLVVGVLGIGGGGMEARYDFAVIALVTGLIATIGSLVSDDIIGFWYCNGKRLAARRAAEKRSLDLSTGP